MASIADMERTDRLQGLWDALAKQVPTGVNRGQFSNYDPLQALTALGGHPDPYMALRFLQLGHELGKMGVGGAQDDNMIQQLLNAFMAQSQGQKR